MPIPFLNGDIMECEHLRISSDGKRVCAFDYKECVDGTVKACEAEKPEPQRPMIWPYPITVPEWKPIYYTISWHGTTTDRPLPQMPYTICLR